MKTLVGLKLALILLLSSLSSWGPISVSWAKTSTCENGECIEKLIDRLEDVGALYKKSCLPTKVDNGLTEECWKYITEINHLEKELAKQQTLLEQRLGCETGDCKHPGQELSLNFQAKKLAASEESLSCSEPKKLAIKKQCPSDMNCVLISSALTVGGYLAEMMVPENAKPKGCHLGDDSCVTQLATGFLKAAISFFEGAWGLLKMAGNAASKKMTEFWSWVRGAEDHSSTSQLAMAKASEDSGVFDSLVNDFPGTMKKIWGALMGSVKEWLKTDIFCQKWSGVPHLSKCQKPTESFDCMSCKTWANGLCAATGTLVAEVVPAFLTGGLVTAVKHGASGAAKISKLFKVSDKGIKAIKNSRAGKAAAETSAKLDKVLKISTGVKATKAAVEAALASIRKYLASPLRKTLKASYASMSKAFKQKGVYLMESPAGKVIHFSGKALKTTGKIVIYPIENPLTVMAYKAGERSFDKVLKLGSPKLAAATTVTTAVTSQQKNLDSLLARIEEAKVKKSKNKDLLKLEEELLSKVEPVRRKLLKEILASDKTEFSDIIKHLYPELQYGDLAKKLPADKILQAEKELFLEIEAMSDGPLKTALTKKFHVHVIQGEARARVVGKSSPTYKQIIDNSKLPSEDRFAEAMKLLKRENLTAEEKAKLSKALEEAHLAGPDNGVFEYSWSELREKYKILTDAGFTKDEADILIRAGLAGRPPVRELLQPGDTLFSGFAEDIVDGNFLEKREKLSKLIDEKYTKRRDNFITRAIYGAEDKTDAITIRDNVESLYFVDYQHNVPELDNFIKGEKTVNKSQMSKLYDEDAFTNFKEARHYLLTDKPAMTKETLLQVHRRMMKGGIEKVPEKDLGKIRDGHWYGGVPASHAIDEAIITEVKNNPYLTWIEHGRTADGKGYGQIMYPNVENVRKEGLDLIQKNHPKLVIEIENYQGLTKKYNTLYNDYNKKGSVWQATPEGIKAREELVVLYDEYTALAKNKMQVTQKLVDAMVDDLMDWFTRERTLIGDINSPQKLDEYVNLVAKFQRDLVSIHPLANGNGRSTREFALSYALMKEGFPPPRIIEPDSDIYKSEKEWAKIIKHGILASDFLMDDLTERLRFGLPIENSVDLITPYTRPPVKVTLKGEKKTPQMEGVEYIDPRLYREIVKRELQKDPLLKETFKSKPVESWDLVHKRVDEVFAKNNIYYKHPKKGIERVEIGYVDEDFKHLYGKSSYHDPELFNFKMKTWYSDDITWRGLASKHAVKSEEEIVSMFKELNTHMASNAVVGKVRGNASPEDIRKAALEDFEKYNDNVFNDGLVQMARDHSETGPMYGISYGYSTSKNRDVGKAFAMGAMVVGEYGAHKAPELQALLKSRVLVGARKAHKDVDLTRLKQVREEFSYKYGRQQEVMGVGASDPDSISIIQTIDAKGEVELTYLRNKNKPNEILVIKGDIDPDATPNPDQIQRTIALKR